MNLALKIIIFLFFIYLSIPSILSVIDGEDNISLCLDLDEDENQKEINFFNVDLAIEKINFFNFSKHLNSLIAFENKFKHDYFFSFIFSPPPNL